MKTVFTIHCICYTDYFVYHVVTECELYAIVIEKIVTARNIKFITTNKKKTLCGKIKMTSKTCGNLHIKDNLYKK